MITEYRRFFSKALGQDFEIKLYGAAGKPVMVFPTSCGRFYDYEDKGMVEAAREFIENGEIRLIAVDGRDTETWYSPVKGPAIAARHAQYEDCVIRDTAGFLKENFGINEKYLATGCSFGAFHAANFFLKYPGLFDSAVCLSGVYGMRGEMGGYWDPALDASDPLTYLDGLKGKAALAAISGGYAVIAHGRGAWETFNHQARALAGLMRAKGITCWYDAWDESWPHDWQTWRAQINKYMSHFAKGVLFGSGFTALTGPGRRLSRQSPPASRPSR